MIQLCLSIRSCLLYTGYLLTIEIIISIMKYYSLKLLMKCLTLLINDSLRKSFPSPRKYLFCSIDSHPTSSHELPRRYLILFVVPDRFDLI